MTMTFFASHKTEHQELIDSFKELQKKFHRENDLLTNEDIEYLAAMVLAFICVCLK
jgi:hemerythrin